MPQLLRFPRSARLLDKAAFARVFDARQRVHSRCFRIHYCPATPADGQNDRRTEDGPRLGMAVSRRAASNAVHRNRIRRQIRESFRHARAGLPDADYVVVALSAAAQADNRQLRLQLDEAWRRLSDKEPD